MRKIIICKIGATKYVALCCRRIFVQFVFEFHNTIFLGKRISSAKQIILLKTSLLKTSPIFMFPTSLSSVFRFDGKARFKKTIEF
ncbi:hypothetical protein BpHYR1_023334 [Brachionus plicatilis]|uniref:Uncharacterized protein n=1 Tax=Brachionus plicatilis TaxID=10195 RepID=A0A3M7SRH8_BRAPC|nr:hypothetical protein BpHYR1_023334 [Brachionus plicatilis]